MVFPAYAGVILRIADEEIKKVCVPRVCGGDPPNEKVILCGWLVFPAYAGVILHKVNSRMAIKSVPRVCGGDPTLYH